MLKDIQGYVAVNFPRFGRNKSQEIVRLLYEVSRKEGVTFSQILQQETRDFPSFYSVKKYLLARRYPNTKKESMSSYSLGSVDFKESAQANVKEKFCFKPRNIYIEKAVLDSPLVKVIRERFVNQSFHEIENHKEYLRTIASGIDKYNERCENLFIVREHHDFFLDCPCSNKSVSCGYHIFNLGIGCPFECAYCHLQLYINSPGIIIPANIEDYFNDFKDYPKHIRLGTGQFTDSLALDHITQYSKSLVNFFRKHTDTIFEMKTKSANIDNLLGLEACENVVIAWSMNPQEIIDSMEFYTASFNERLHAAMKCAQAGYKVAFHFDPIIRIPGWEKHYKEIVNEIFGSISPQHIAWISLGGLRMSPKLKKIIENRFPDNPILNEELILKFDRKLRYSQSQRVEIYQKMLGWIRFHNKTTSVYLCMEDPQVFKACQLEPYHY